MKTNKHIMTKGYTLTEVMLSVVILSAVFFIAITGWLYVIRGERLNNVQNELDIDVRRAMERIKSELRLSSLDCICYYPAGLGPYTAMSFPMARDDDGDGLIELDSNGKVIWDKTMVYHVWSSSPNQLRLTVFDPRDNSLTDAQRQEQLNSVVANGKGDYTYNGANAETIPIFENLFDWEIYTKGASYDAYSPVLDREQNVSFGSIALSSGSHLFRFRTVGKNTSSSGFVVGLDSLVVSACGAAREAEAQTISAQSGATAGAEYRSEGSWGGNYQLTFPATATGQYVTLSMANDCWEETNFRDTGAICEDTIVEFDQTISPKDFVVKMPNQTNTWQANWQTLNDVVTSSSNSALQGCAVRIPIRGGMQPDGGAIYYNGPMHCIYFYSAYSKPLKIMGAYMHESADDAAYGMDIQGSGIELYSVDTGRPDVTISAGSYTRFTNSTELTIQKEKSYFITFLVADDPGNSDARVWDDKHSPPLINSYILPASESPTLADCTTSWSLRTNVLSDTRLFAIEHIHTLAPSNGVFTSQIFDTHMDTPPYTEMTWDAIKPSGTAVKMKVRTGANADLSDASSWSNIAAMTSGGSINPGDKRYVQFQACLYSGTAGYYVPTLKDVAIRWTGPNKVVDIGGTITKGPEYGVFDVYVDDKPLTKGLTVDLTIYEDVIGFGGKGSNRLTSTMSAEIEPRNTGK